MFQTYWVGSPKLLIASSLVSVSLIVGICPAIAEPLSQGDRVSQIDSPANSLADIPEEVLRTEIYTEARSPVDGKLLSAAEYIELDESLQATVNNIPPRLLVSERLQKLIDLLKLRRLIRQVIPFF